MQQADVLRLMAHAKDSMATCRICRRRLYVIKGKLYDFTAREHQNPCRRLDGTPRRK